jgi:replicative DNA helicase
LSGKDEVLFISAVLRQGDVVTPLSNGVTTNWFHSHKEEWDWIEQYIKKQRKCPSKVLFKDRFPDFQLLKSDDIDYTTRQLRESHVRYSLINSVDETLLRLKDNDDPIAVLEKTYQQLAGIQLEAHGGQNESEILSDWEATFTEVARRYERTQERGMAGVSTGFATLDLLTGGPQPGDYWIVAARLGQGKTWTLIRMACSALYADSVVQYDALEQSKAQIAMRCHSFLSSKYAPSVFKTLDLMHGKDFDLVAYREFLKGLEGKLEGRLVVDDTSRGRVSPASIASQIERNRPDIVFIDYLTLINSGGDDWRAMAELSGEIKGIAMRYEVPIVAAAQINRMAIGNDVPGAEHLAASDAIGQDADAVITMKQMSARVIKMKLAKFRHGMDGQTWFNEFAPNSGRFEEISGDSAQDIIDEDKVNAGS